MDLGLDETQWNVLALFFRFNISTYLDNSLIIFKTKCKLSALCLRKLETFAEFMIQSRNGFKILIQNGRMKSKSGKKMSKLKNKRRKSLSKLRNSMPKFHSLLSSILLSFWLCHQKHFCKSGCGSFYVEVSVWRWFQSGLHLH